MLKRVTLTLLFAAFFLLAQAQTNPNSHRDGYELTFKINGVSNSMVKLAFHLGDKQYLQDSAKADAAGKVVFSGTTALEPGIYMIVPNKGKLFEVLIGADNQIFSMETDTANLIKNMKVKNSPDNRLFYDYLAMTDKKQAELKPLQDKFKKFKDTNKDSAEVYRKKLANIDQEVKDYKNKLMLEQPKTFLAAIFRGSWEPDVPDAPKGPDGKPLDPEFPYHYFKAHYWDKFDFSDKRMIRTPLLHSKLRFYLDKLTVPTPDSIFVSAKLISDKAKANRDVFEYVVNHITNYYENSKTMGFETVFVLMAKEYYLTKQADWIDSTTYAKIKERVLILDPILLGKPALDLNLPDTTGKDVKLSSVKAEYTIIFFWDPTCGHCQKETPYVVDFYNRAKGKGIEVYAVGSGGTKEEWKKFIRDKKMNFFNVYDELGYRKFYDIYATPVIYLLDKNKNIRAKRLDVPQLEDFMLKQYKIALPPSTLPKEKDKEEPGH